LGAPIYTISGASGWLGKTTLNYLIRELGVSPKNILLIGSRERKEIFQHFEFKIQTFKTIPKDFYTDYYFDYSFVTKEIEQTIGHAEYLSINRSIIKSSEDFILKHSPRSIFLSSSGAIYTDKKSTKIHSCYKQLKLEQEERIGIASQLRGSSLSTCRIFNLSGRFISKVNTFALSNFISSALLSQRITVVSDFPVYRRYCNDKELVELVLSLMSRNQTVTFDSGGYKIELRDLAILVREAIGRKIELQFPAVNNSLSASNYFSKSQKYEQLLSGNLGRRPMSLLNQVEETVKGMKEN